MIRGFSREYRINAAVVSSALSLCALHFSPALSSITLFLFFACTFSLFDKAEFLNQKILVIAALLWCICQFTIQFGFGYDNESMRKVLLRLPLLLLPAIWCIRTAVAPRFLAVVILCLGVFHSWIGGASVLNYFAHFRFLNQMVLESKPLPLFSSVYHIEFSLILAVVSILQLSFLRNSGNGWQRGLMFASLLINILSLHILSARTGIIAFWLGVPFLSGTISLPKWLNGPRKWLLLLLPLFLLMAVPSLRNRVINTIEDLMAVKQSQNLSDKSFGRRWEAWKVAAETIKEKPLSGVGMSGVENAIQSGFERKQSYLPITDRIQPHNQFLELALQTGLIPLVIFLISMLLVFLHYRNKGNFAGLAVLAALGVSMFFESYLERQSGVGIFIVSFFFVLFAEKKE